MNKRRIAASLCAFAILVVGLAGCGSKVTSKLDGKWSYIYDTEKTALKISGDKAVLDGKSYEYSLDDEKIYLKDSKGYTAGLSYKEAGEDGIYLYKEATYEYQGDGSPDGILGIWVDVSNGNSNFEFTSQGTFKEDSYIPGYYTVDEANGSISFVYNDHYEDTTIYYTTKDNYLIVEYPWPMVRTSK